MKKFRSGGGYNCVSYQCNNNSLRNRSVKYHQFPKDLNRAAIWVRNLNNPDLQSKFEKDKNCIKFKKVCSAHFETKEYNNSNRLYLKPHAIPTIVTNEIFTNSNQLLLVKSENLMNRCGNSREMCFKANNEDLLEDKVTVEKLDELKDFDIRNIESII